MADKKKDEKKPRVFTPTYQVDMTIPSEHFIARIGKGNASVSVFAKDRRETVLQISRPELDELLELLQALSTKFFSMVDGIGNTDDDK